MRKYTLMHTPLACFVQCWSLEEFGGVIFIFSQEYLHIKSGMLFTCLGPRPTPGLGQALGISGK